MESPRNELAPREQAALRIDTVRIVPDAPLDGASKIDIKVDIDLTVNGDLGCYVLVRRWHVGQVDSVAPVYVDAQPGRHTLTVTIPPSTLGGGHHAVDVEAWLGDRDDPDDCAVVATNAARLRIYSTALNRRTCLTLPTATP